MGQETGVKIVFHYDAGPELARRLDELSAEDLDVAICKVADRERFDVCMKDARVIWHVLEPLTAEAIAAAPDLQLIQKIGVGVNTIDLDAARERGVRVCNMPGTNSRAVAEATLGLMLAALRRLPFFDAATRRGEGWAWTPELQDQLGELGGRTVGLVGYGAVPRALAPMLRALDVSVLYTDLHPVAEAVGEFCDLDELLARSDLVSLHVPLTPETEGMLDEHAIARMKRGAILINTARGALVDEQALIRALRAGQLRAAGLDAFREEPLPPTSPLLALDNVVLTPHVAWLTQETLARSLSVAIENCRRLSRGAELLHRVV